MAILFTFCMMLSLVSIQVFAAEGDITEVNINGVSNELWSYKNVQFATVDESSNYTIEKQRWYSESGEITPTSTSLRPTEGENYSFIITLKAKDGYVFPTKENAEFYSGVFKINGTQYDDAAVIVTSEKNSYRYIIRQYKSQRSYR